MKHLGNWQQAFVAMDEAASGGALRWCEAARAGPKGNRLMCMGTKHASVRPPGSGCARAAGRGAVEKQQNHCKYIECAKSVPK